MSDGTWIGTRHAQPWEHDAITRGHQCQRERDQAVLAGVLTGESPRVVPQGLDLPAIHAEIRQRRVDDIHLPVLR